MEGGFLPWKRETNYANSGDYSVENMTIPKTTPSGQVWEKAKNGEFKLVEAKNDGGAADPTEADAPATVMNEVLHKVNRHTDTLEGICLKYKTNRRHLQKLNSFTGNNLNLAPDILKIPNPHGLTFETKESDELRIAMEQNAKIRDFCILFPTLSSKEARLYLVDAEWDYTVAAKEATQDIEWESSDRALSKERKNSRFNERVDEGIAFNKMSKIMDKANASLGGGGELDGETEPSPKATEMKKMTTTTPPAPTKANGKYQDHS